MLKPSFFEKAEADAKQLGGKLRMLEEDLESAEDRLSDLTAKFDEKEKLLEETER